MNERVVVYEVAPPVARVTLNRPDKLNALSYALVDELGEAIARAAADSTVKVVVLPAPAERSRPVMT